MVVFLLGMAAIVSATALVQPTAFLKGLVVGIGVTTAVGTLWFAATTRHSSQHLRYGAWGEENTASLFERPSMRIRGWHVVHALEFEGFGDIDHVAAGPAGVLAIESKWTNTPWCFKDGHLVTNGRDPIAQARAGATKIKRFLRWKGLDVEVCPVVVVWGPGANAGFEKPRWDDGVVVLNGSDSRAWLRNFGNITGTSIEQSTAKVVHEVLADYVANHPGERPESAAIARRVPPVRHNGSRRLGR